MRRAARGGRVGKGGTVRRLNEAARRWIFEIIEAQLIWDTLKMGVGRLDPGRSETQDKIQFKSDMQKSNPLNDSVSDSRDSGQGESS